MEGNSGDGTVVGTTEKATARLARLGTLAPGWMDGEGLPAADAAVCSAVRILELRPALAGPSRIYPTLAGGVQIELEAGGWSLSFEFGADGSAEIAGTREDGSRDFGPSSRPSIDDVFLGMLDAAVAGGSPEAVRGDR